MQESFVFYRSFYESIKNLEPVIQAEIYNAIMEYALDNKLPENLSGIAYAIFTLIKPQIDANNRRRKNGEKGGRPKTEIKPKNNLTITENKPNNNLDKTEIKPNYNLNETETEPNVNVNDNVNVNNSGGNIRVAKVKRIVNLYHQYCPSLPKVLRLTEKRMKIIEDRLSEYTEEELIEIFKKVEGNSFLREGSKKWKGADFDFIMDKEKIVKIAEGFYEWGSNANKGIQKSKYDFAALQKMIDGG